MRDDDEVTEGDVIILTASDILMLERAMKAGVDDTDYRAMYIEEEDVD